ncbi:hypothetical protein N8628_04265 [Verrucomicrobia bacterium]|nr:hypothetical protein [Verrucomicrobiota bacterium]
MIVAINASRAKSGGGMKHIIEILRSYDKKSHNIKQIHIWSYSGLNKLIPNFDHLYKHDAPNYGGSLMRQVFWERFIFPKELSDSQIDILLNVDAGSVCQWQPSVSISRDMLPYEPGEIERYGFSQTRLKYIFLKCIQTKTMQRSKGVIFLSEHAQNMILKKTGRLVNTKLVPHGLSNEFHSLTIKNNILNKKNKINILYISNALPYKHQWNVVIASSYLREKGYNVHLKLVGGGIGAAEIRTNKAVYDFDPQ